MSHGWRGILTGREVLKLGIGWAIGDGKDVNLWNENWLSTSEAQRPIGPPNLTAQAMTVKDLLHMARQIGTLQLSAIFSHSMRSPFA